MSWLKKKFAAQIQRALSGAPPTFWNGERTECSIVRVIVGEAPAGWWCAKLKGTEREAVMVETDASVFFLDNDAFEAEAAGQGWRKVTVGRGSPRYGHRSLPVERLVR